MMIRWGKGDGDARWTSLPDPLPTQPVPGARKLMDYGARTDGNPEYIGTNDQAALVSDATWLVQKLFYDVDDRVTDVQLLEGAWTTRASLAWRSAGGD